MPNRTKPSGAMAAPKFSNLQLSDSQLSGVDPVQNVLQVGQIENFLLDMPTGIRESAPETWEECFCALHVKVDCDDKYATGCRAKKPGTLPMLAALYGKHVVRRCHAEPATRKNDWVFAQKLLDLTVNRMALFDRPEEDVLQLAQGQLTSVEDWGAGFCYQLPVLSSARLRAGRVLGPICLAVDVLRLVRCVGLKSMARLQVLYIDGIVHVVKDKRSKGVDTVAGQRFALDLMRLVEEHGPELRIGFDPVASRVEALKAFLAGKGVSLGRGCDADLRVALHVAASMPPDVPEGKVALRRLALVGDRAMKLVLAEKTVRRLGMTVEQISRVEAVDQSDQNFARLGKDSGLLDYVISANGVDVASAKVGGTAFEAVAGVVYLDGGVSAVEVFMDAMGARLE